MSRALQILIAVTCVVVIGAVGYWGWSQAQSAAERGRCIAGLRELAEAKLTDAESLARQEAIRKEAEKCLLDRRISETDIDLIANQRAER